MRQTAFIIAVILILLLTPMQSTAEIHGSGLSVVPTRLILDRKNRSLPLTLINKGAKTSTYRITTINSIMSENGQKTVIKDKSETDQVFADRLIRYAPRQITLKPGEQQTVRVMLRLPQSLPEGEYKTGLNFQWVPDQGAPDIGKEQPGKNEISVRIDFAFGITVPIIVRHGNLSASGKIADFSFITSETGGKEIEIILEREGNRSLYGNLKILHDKNGKETILEEIRGIAVYVPNSRRIFRMPISEEKLKNLQAGKDHIRVEYREPTESGGKLIAEKRMPFN